MANTVRKTRKSAVPIYGAAAAWAAYAVFFDLYRVSHFLFAALLSGGVYLLLQSLCPEEPLETESAAAPKEEPETTGSTELDNHLRSIVMNVTNDGMTQEQKLRALYVYTRDSFTYLRRPAYPFGVLDFMQEDALRILNTGYGNCYCYASLFWYLSRWIGYDSLIYSGTVGGNRSPHSWVEISFDGRYYIFDTELEMAYHKKGRYDINLYKTTGSGWNYRK